MFGAKLPRPPSVSKFSQRRRWRGPSYSKQRHSTIGRWLRQLGGCVSTLAFVFLLLLMSAGLPDLLFAAHRWPNASVSSAYDLGTDDGPSRLSTQAAELQKADGAEPNVEGAQIAQEPPQGLLAYGAMVGTQSARPGESFMDQKELDQRWPLNISDSGNGWGHPKCF
jgi:hypothetical protein